MILRKCFYKIINTADYIYAENRLIFNITASPSPGSEDGDSGESEIIRELSISHEYYEDKLKNTKTDLTPADTVEKAKEMIEEELVAPFLKKLGSDPKYAGVKARIISAQRAAEARFIDRFPKIRAYVLKKATWQAILLNSVRELDSLHADPSKLALYKREDYKKRAAEFDTESKELEGMTVPGMESDRTDFSDELSLHSQSMRDLLSANTNAKKAEYKLILDNAPTHLSSILEDPNQMPTKAEIDVLLPYITQLQTIESELMKFFPEDAATLILVTEAHKTAEATYYQAMARYEAIDPTVKNSIDELNKHRRNMLDAHKAVNEADTAEKLQKAESWLLAATDSYNILLDSFDKTMIRISDVVEHESDGTVTSVRENMGFKRIEFMNRMKEQFPEQHDEILRLRANFKSQKDYTITPQYTNYRNIIDEYAPKVGMFPPTSKRPR